MVFNVVGNLILIPRLGYVGAAIATILSATLSCDHRVIDGAVGAQFLKVLGEEIAALA